MTEKAVAALMKKYEAEKEGLHNTQQKNRRNQEDKLKVLRSEKEMGSACQLGGGEGGGWCGC